MASLDWGNVPGWLTFGTAAVALIYADHQLRSNRQIAAQALQRAREAAALETWNAYLRLCFENPEYSCADQARNMMRGKTLANLADQETPESEKYQWFISSMLNSCEQVILGIADSAEWENTIVDQIWYHAEAVRQLWGAWAAHYDSRMDRLVHAALKKAQQ